MAAFARVGGESDAQEGSGGPAAWQELEFLEPRNTRRFARARFPYGESALPATTCALRPVASAIPAAAYASNTAVFFCVHSTNFTRRGGAHH